MGSSYFITYGGNRLTFPGTPGPVAWEFEHPMVVLFPGAALTNDYLKMRFVTPDSQEIILEAGSGNTASASARVPVGSTAYWTANGYQDHTGIKWHVSALYNTGFSAVSANTAVTTSFYENPNSASNGSAVLTATGYAAATVATHGSYLTTFGEGNSYQISLSASSFAGDYLSPLGTAQRTAWIPSGGNIRFSASSTAGQTYSIQSITVTALSNTSITWAHNNPGTNMLFTGTVTAANTQCRLGDGRQKLVYATGYNRVLAAAQGLVSAASWQPHNIITAFSSNLCSGTASNSFIAGSGNAGKVRGFASSNTVGTMKNSAGTWSNATSSVNTYKWSNRYFMNNSAHVTATFSAVRSKGPTASNNASYVFYGKNTAGNSVSRLSEQFALPTQSGKTATKTASGNFSTTTFQDEAYAILSNTVAQSTALYANAIGYFTASGRVQ